MTYDYVVRVPAKPFWFELPFMLLVTPELRAEDAEQRTQHAMDLLHWHRETVRVAQINPVWPLSARANPVWPS